MTTAFWLEVLRVELGAIDNDDLIEPSGDPESGEKIVGELSLELRKIYTRSQKAEAEVMRFTADARCAKNDKARDQALEKANELQNKADVLMRIMWIGIRDEFNLWAAGTVGLRKGWKVVKPKHEPPQIPDILRKLLGG